MKFKIIHKTEYQFSKAVFLEPHYLMFKPKSVPHVELESHSLKLSIVTAGMSEQVDAEGNFVHFCWFDGLYDKITIVSESILQSKARNPFNFLIYPLYFNTIPFFYTDSLKMRLARHLATEPIHENLIQYGNNILVSKNHQTLAFLTELTIAIHADFIVETREEGIPFEPNITFLLKKGSCRDLVWMQIQLLRHLGIATRFVSGYYYIDIENPQFELHAWTEVFLPGAGWMGFDPSNGIITGHTHIAIAASSHFINTMPVSGTVRGDATSTLKTKLQIEAFD